jgi:hypothetical protein
MRLVDIPLPRIGGRGPNLNSNLFRSAKRWELIEPDLTQANPSAVAPWLLGRTKWQSELSSRISDFRQSWHRMDFGWWNWGDKWIPRFN